MRGAHGLGELEADIMAVLWDNAQLITVRDVLTALQRPAAYTTVMTVMDNLHRKGLLTRERRGRAYHYRPLWSREEYTARLMRTKAWARAVRRVALFSPTSTMRALPALSKWLISLMSPPA